MAPQADPGAVAWRGEAAFEEIWFLQLRTTDGLGLWLRYTLQQGVTRQAAVWAVCTRGAHVRAERASLPLEALSHQHGSWWSADIGALGPTRATGTCGAIGWDLELHRGGPDWQHVPSVVRALGIGRTYVPAAADLRVRGRLTIDGADREIVARGVLGHIFGGRNRVRTWAWCHQAGFTNSTDTVFEGLSARLQGAPRPLTSVALSHQGRRYTFSTVRDLLTTSSSIGTSTWTFTARSAHARLEGTMRLPDGLPVLVGYQDTEGNALWCSNTRFAELSLRLSEAASGRVILLRCDDAAGEIASRMRPDGDVLIGEPAPDEGRRGDPLYL